MNINKFGAFISYLTALSGKHHDTYEVEAIAKYVTDLNEQPKASCEEVDELLKQMLSNQLIPAIKAYRVLTNAGLKEAKDAVERYHGPIVADKS